MLWSVTDQYPSVTLTDGPTPALLCHATPVNTTQTPVSSRWNKTVVFLATETHYNLVVSCALDARVTVPKNLPVFMGGEKRFDSHLVVPESRDSALAFLTSDLFLISG